MQKYVPIFSIWFIAQDLFTSIIIDANSHLRQWPILGEQDLFKLSNKQQKLNANVLIHSYLDSYEHIIILQDLKYVLQLDIGLL